MGSTFWSNENSTVFCSSCTLPLVILEMDRMPNTREPEFPSSGSWASPITNSRAAAVLRRPVAYPAAHHLPTCAVVPVQHHPGYMIGFCRVNNSVSNVLPLGDSSQRETRLRAVLIQIVSLAVSWIGPTL
jgi:hypothetical protein